MPVFARLSRRFYEVHGGGHRSFRQGVGSCSVASASGGGGASGGRVRARHEPTRE